MSSVPCPRCQAEGERSEVILHDGYGVCPRCKSTWERGSLGQLIAVGHGD